jgi:predicted extracellular nuclease
MAHRRVLQWAVLLALISWGMLIVAFLPLFASPLPSPSNTIVISQVYGAGGNSGAPYRNDFIELFNLGTTTVSLNGWSVQYASSKIGRAHV